ncbi:GGDEF domain-containing protein [Pseudochelatococcus contaminans]|uniref:diguanylate cyclase n=1 Tax=Pseudochelatococcus contaminans TaxID=1538103 RepID=A0A7W5Z1J2_9HYPH|nr:GGDEF domain-containing protein [Pseudochelatococcus contaminans]MBB3808288.1 diguanylate cyclase (GGDEF)-like protein [Pseudochelatococcus contaminans]
MQLDEATLRIVAILFSLLIGGLLLFSWNSNRVNRELLVLGSSFGSAAVGIVLIGIASLGQSVIYLYTGVTLLFFAYGGGWQTMRIFERRPVKPWLAGLGGIFWLALSLIDPEHGPLITALAVAVVPASYTALMGFELWRGRGEYLPSRFALCMVVGLDSVLLVMRGVFIMIAASEAHRWTETQLTMTLSLLIVLVNVAVGYLMLSLIKERLETEQRAQTLIDPLTGLGNRRALHLHAERILRRQATSGQSVCVAIIDLDHFKKINDTFGHFMGDSVLRTFAERATLKLRPVDYLFRVGGEEFLCILQAAEERDAVGVMERIRRSMKSYRIGEGTEARGVTLSAGIASSRRVGYDLEDLTRAADAALYKAKRDGRNRVCVYTGDDTRLAADVEGRAWAEPRPQAGPLSGPQLT